MADNYVGEIRIFAGNFAPVGWMFCDGNLLPISENEILFNVIGTTYGGDGQSTFAIPDLRGRLPIHQGTGGGGTYTIGEAAGTEQETLTIQQIPSHGHTPRGNTVGGSDDPTNNFWGNSNTAKPYSNTGGPLVNLNATIVQVAGGSQPHENLHPYLGLNYIISLFGLFPTQ